MAFNGDAGAKFIGDVGSVGTLQPAGAYISYVRTGVSTAGHWRVTGDGGPRFPLMALSITGLSLTAWNGVAAVGDPAQPMTGVLMSAVPTANRHGLPVNFGPGRGNWVASDLARLLVLHCVDAYSYAAGPYQNPNADIQCDVAIANGDVVITLSNVGKANTGTQLDLNLVYLHTALGVEPAGTIRGNV